MNTSWNSSVEEFENAERRTLLKSAGIAAGIYIVAFVVTVYKPWALIHTRTIPNVDVAQFIDAEVVPQEKPHISHLTASKPSVQEKAPTPEKAISKVADQGKVDKNANPMEDKNVTQSDGGASTRGALVLYSPPPKLPDYLKDRDLKASVLIEFTIFANGTHVPKLVGPSGDDELDALALTAVKSWRFSPAVAEYKPIDSKIRLRINFVVD
jgi:TonB family protein